MDLSQDPDSKAVTVNITKVSTAAKTPTYGTSGAAGADLYASEDVLIPARDRALVNTGLKMELPLGVYARIAPRSGLAWKHKIDVSAGVVDMDYRGILQVLLVNNNDNAFHVRAGERVAQLILECYSRAVFVETPYLSETARGAGGFGSTGSD